MTSIKTLGLVGYPIGLLLLSLAGGRVSKKNLLIGFHGLTTVGFILLLLKQSFLLSGIGLFLCITGDTANFYILMTFVTEIVSLDYAPAFAAMISFCCQLGEFAPVPLYYAFRDYHKVLIYYFLTPIVISMGMLIFFLEDTPICMVAMSSPEHAFKSLKNIAKHNRIETTLTL